MKPFKNVLFFSITFVLLLNISSCKKDSLKSCNEHSVSVCNEDPTKINISIRNVSDYDFCNVILNPSLGNRNYGIIEKGQSTCHRSFDLAYDYAYVQLFIGDKEFILQPIDYVGEQSLNIGNHTYSINVTDFDIGKLSIEVD
tara:strand:- start:18 stop:443 length:426 start_codon:yes stop_codon:yes gene_type:complete